jgi:hypothetical protein
MDLLRLLRSARWLTTGQVHRRFFPRAGMSAARRRLRRLAEAGYVRKYQENRMQEALFTLGREGRQWLERDGVNQIGLERHPPKQWEHLAGINDIRIAAELTGQLAYFFAAWELAGIGWKYPIIPDAVFRIGDRTFAAEYDRGAEGLRYFVGSKIAWYRRRLPGFSLAAVLVVADREARKQTLARAVGGEGGPFFFTTIETIRHQGLPESIRDRSTCSLEPLRRENNLLELNVFESIGYEETKVAS